jgi:hypothetical protein
MTNVDPEGLWVANVAGGVAGFVGGVYANFGYQTAQGAKHPSQINGLELLGAGVLGALGGIRSPIKTAENFVTALKLITEGGIGGAAVGYGVCLMQGK